MDRSGILSFGSYVVDSRDLDLDFFFIFNKCAPFCTQYSTVDMGAHDFLLGIAHMLQYWKPSKTSKRLKTLRKTTDQVCVCILSSNTVHYGQIYVKIVHICIFLTLCRNCKILQARGKACFNLIIFKVCLAIMNKTLIKKKWK